MHRGRLLIVATESRFDSGRGRAVHAAAASSSKSRQDAPRWRALAALVAVGLFVGPVVHLVATSPHDAPLLRAAMLLDLILVGVLGAYALELIPGERTPASGARAPVEGGVGGVPTLLELLAAQVPLGLACFDRTLRCVVVNEALALLDGLPVETHPGRTVSELVRGPAGEDMAEDMSRVIATGTPLLGLLVKAETPVHPDERRSWIVSYYPLRVPHAGSEIVGVGLAVDDVTDRAREERDRERLVSDLRASVRARDDFLSIASHELRTPLSTLSLGTSDLIRAADSGKVPTPPVLRRQAERLRKQAQRLERLVATVLDVSRIVQGRVRFFPERVDAAAIICEHSERLREDATRAGTTLRLSCHGPIVGSFDRTRLEQIVDNLLSNAIKFGGGKPVDVTVQATREIVRLTVIDRGMGIPKEDQARIFERFERAVSSKHYGGLGLGLWVVRQIVESMAGTIFVTSEIGQGSTFVVEWPRGLT